MSRTLSLILLVCDNVSSLNAVSVGRRLANDVPPYNPITVHGAIMITAWGFLLPLGILSSRFLRHRSDGLWFTIHRSLNMLTVLLAVIGVLVAIYSFGNVFVDDGWPAASSTHSALGLSVLGLSLVQVSSGIFRPDKSKYGEKSSMQRVLWEGFHKGVGYLTAILAYITMYLGVRLAEDKKATFMIVWYASLIFVLAVVLVMMVDKMKAKNNQSETKQFEQTNDVDDNDDE